MTSREIKMKLAASINNFKKLKEANTVKCDSPKIKRTYKHKGNRL